MIIVLGSESIIKKTAVGTVLNEFSKKKIIPLDYSLKTHKVNYSFPVTPHGKETYDLAQKRVEILAKEFKNIGDLFVGVENGLIQRYGHWYEECWCIIKNNSNEYFTGYSSGLSLPTHIVDQMQKGEKHHEILKQMIKEGQSSQKTWDIYTNGTIVREKSIEEAFRNAFYYAVQKYK